MAETVGLIAGTAEVKTLRRVRKKRVPVGIGIVVEEIDKGGIEVAQEIGKAEVVTMKRVEFATRCS